MDPKDNTEPNGVKDAQTNISDATPADATQPMGMGDAPSLSPDGPTSTASSDDQSQSTNQGVEVDLSNLSGTGAADNTSDSTTTPENMPASDPMTSPVAFNADVPQTPAPAESPTTFDPTATDPSSSAPGTTPPVNPNFGATPGGNTDQIFGSAPTSPLQPVNPDSAMPGQPSAPASMPDQSAGAGVQPTAPVPAPQGDKKTIIVLGAVAVILIAAIVVLFLL